MNEVQTTRLDSNDYMKKATQYLYIITLGIVTSISIINQENIYTIIKYNLLSVILASIIMIYAKDSKTKVIQDRNNLYMVVGFFLFSLISVFLTLEFPIYYLWLVGPMIITIITDIHLGLSVHLLFAFFLSIISDYSIDRLIYNFILGALACILAKYIIEIRKVGYALVIFVSSNISLMIIMNNFMRTNTLNMNILQAVITSILLFFIVSVIYIIYKISDKKTYEQQVSGQNKDINEAQNEETVHCEESIIIESDMKEHMNYVTESSLIEELKSYQSEDYILLRELKAYSEKLYHRSIQIGDISHQASQRIHINSDLSRVGGYYCKIGRIVSEDYINEGIHILENCEFPQVIIDIVRQHNLKYGNPRTKEAAVVMLTDNIISSIDTMKAMKDKKTISCQKLIEGIFTLRLKKGNLEESGLDIKEIKILNEFYQEIFKDS